MTSMVIHGQSWSSMVHPSSMGVLLGIFGGGVPPASPNPDPISDQKMPFSTPVDLASRIHTRFQT